MDIRQEYQEIFDWVDRRQTAMLDDVIAWSNINSYTFHAMGLRSFSEKLKEAFAVLQGDLAEIDLPVYQFIDAAGETRDMELAPALMISKRPWASKQGLFVIHMDTFYPPQESLQEAVLIQGRYLKGQGVTDAKGGIAVLLQSLAALEQTEVAQRIGWKVIIIPDEGTGLSCSAGLLKETAAICDMGFVFEPCLPSGNLIGARKGCGYFTIVAHGRPVSRTKPYAMDDRCHPGAIEAIASCISRLSGLNASRRNLTVNIGLVQGGRAVHLVPELAIVRFDVRVSSGDDQSYVEEQLRTIVNETARAQGLRLTLYGGFSVPPKPLEGKTLSLYEHIRDCASEMGLSLKWLESPEICSGNRLQAAGLPTIDTLGVQGGHIHSPAEFLYIDSLKERVKLTLLFLLKWAHQQVWV